MRRACLLVNNGGELRVFADTTLVRGSTVIGSGGQLNAQPGVDLEYNGAALLQFAGSHAVDDGVHLKATGGGDISAVSFIDVGNDVSGSLTVTGAGSTLTAQGSVSDWGAAQSGNATVTISNSGLATVSALSAGSSSATFVGNVTSGGTLRTTSTFRMGGGSTVRTVSLTINGGALQTDGLATFNNQADLNLVGGGTIAFNGGATFNVGSRFDWTGGTVSLGAAKTLLVDGGVVNRTSTSGFGFSGGTTTRIRGGGNFTTPSFFDLDTATLDMNNGTLTVGTTGGTVSDWGRSSGVTTTATLANNALATYNSGLRMSESGGTTNSTISSGARLVANGSLSTGGNATSNVTLNVTGGRVDSNGSINLLRGTTTTVSAAGVVEGQDVVLGSSGGTSTTTVTGANSLLKARGLLNIGPFGTTMLTISSGGKVESLGSAALGEGSGGNGTVNVSGLGSRLDIGSSLFVGIDGIGQLTIDSGGFVKVTGGVTFGSSGGLLLTSDGILETTPGQSIVNNGEMLVGSSSQVRADVVNAGRLGVNGAGITRGVTLRSGSTFTLDTATVGSLVQQPGADIKFSLRTATDFDDLTVTGAASLGGDFIVSLANGFSPTEGMSFPILTAGSITAQPNFDFSAAVLPSGLGWGLSFAPTGLALTVIPVAVLNGDYNNNGTVDAADYTRYRDALGTTTVLPNDPTGGVIGTAQYNTWRNNFNQSGSMNALAASASVPEPASVVVLLALLVNSRGATLRGVRRQ